MMWMFEFHQEHPVLLTCLIKMLNYVPLNDIQNGHSGLIMHHD